LELILSIAAGMLLGGAASWLYLRVQAQGAFDRGRGTMEAERAALVERGGARGGGLARLEKKGVELRAAREAEDGNNAELRAENARLNAELEAERAMLTEKLGVLTHAQEQLSSAFRALSAQALQANNQSFLDLAGQALGKFQQGAQGDLEKRQQ